MSRHLFETFVCFCELTRVWVVGQVAKCICGPAGSYVTLHMLRGKKQMPVSVKLLRRSLREVVGAANHHAREVAKHPASSVDARIASLVADMTHNEVRVRVVQPAVAVEA